MHRGQPIPITVDCANGVGAPQLYKLASEIGSELFNVKIVNGDISTLGKLNKNVIFDH